MLGDYESIAHLLNDPRAKRFVTSQLRSTGGLLQSDDFLKIIDRVTGTVLNMSYFVPLEVCAKLGNQLWSAMGISVSVAEDRSFANKFAYVALACICHLARSGIDIVSISEGTSGSVIEARIPANFWTWEGRLFSGLHQSGGIVEVSAAVTFKGQSFDWGRGNKIVAELLASVEIAAADLLSQGA